MIMKLWHGLSNMVTFKNDEIWFLPFLKHLVSYGYVIY